MFRNNMYIQRGLEIQDKKGEICVGSQESVFKHLENLGREECLDAKRRVRNAKARGKYRERKELEDAKRLVHNARAREKYRVRKELENAKRLVHNAKARERYARKRRDNQVKKITEGINKSSL